MTDATMTTDRAQRHGLDELVRRVRPIAGQPADPATIAEQVADVLTELSPSTQLLTDDERAGSADNYQRHTLHAEESFSLMALVWRPGQRTEIHDHLVWCTFAVLAGAETETLYRVDGTDGDGLHVVGELDRPTGSVSGVAPPDDIHRVTNTGTGVAITLHVYGADLSAGTSVRRTYPEPSPTI